MWTYKNKGKYKRKVKKAIKRTPVRFIIAILIILIEISAVLCAAVLISLRSAFFFIIAAILHIFCVLRIVASEDNPDYKVPWLLMVFSLPIIGFMLYFMFYSRKLKPRFIKRLRELKNSTYSKNDDLLLEKLKDEDVLAYSQAKMLCNISDSHLFIGTKQTYFTCGEEMFGAMLKDLEDAEKFIFMEYFIIEEGLFWDTILDVLKRKVKQGVEVKVIYDDIGCMKKLSGYYYRTLRKYGIEATVFSKLRGNVNGEFNNRSHRKITVIDGKIGYTGGINLADEYINKVEKFGHWKDTAIRLEGDAVWELTKLFYIDFGINVKKTPVVRNDSFPQQKEISEKGYMVPFGDGPRPIYKHFIGKSVIQNLLNDAIDYVYITTPYLIIDNELCKCIENASMRGVAVKIIVPHIPDKKLVFNMTKSYYKRLLSAGVEIYEYKSGFMHGKNYIADGKYAMIGTINLDYRSLVHHFENAVWMYNCQSIKDMETDFEKTLEKSIKVNEKMLKTSFWQRFLRTVVKIFAPLL